MSGPLGGNGTWGCVQHRGQSLVAIRRDAKSTWVRCLICGRGWRSKARYARRLPMRYGPEVVTPTSYFL